MLSLWSWLLILVRFKVIDSLKLAGGVLAFALGLWMPEPAKADEADGGLRPRDEVSQPCPMDEWLGSACRPAPRLPVRPAAPWAPTELPEGPGRHVVMKSSTLGAGTFGPFG